MPKPFLLLLFFFFSHFAGAQKAITFTQAIAEGKVEVTLKSVGGHSGRCIAVHFEKKTDKSLKIIIPAGHVFQPADSAYQQIIAIKSEEFVLTKPKQFIKIQGLCAQSHHASPSSTAPFLVGSMAVGNLLQMAEFIASNKLWNVNDAQYAIWSITDSVDVASIGHKALQQKACELLGVPLPEYKAKYNITPPAPSARPRPVLERTPFSYEGAFEYRSNTEVEIAVYVEDTSGTRVRTIFEHQKHLPGWAKYSFYFKTTKLKKGIYWVVLYADDQVVKKIKIKY